MKTLVKVSGKVTAAQTDTAVYTSTSIDGHTNAASTTTSVTNTTMFRIDNQPARMMIKFNIAVGDQVTAAGHRTGELEVWAIKNHTTKTMYWIKEPSAIFYVLAVVGVVIGLIMLSIFPIGHISLAYSAYEIWKTTNRKNTIQAAKRMVEAA